MWVWAIVLGCYICVMPFGALFTIWRTRRAFPSSWDGFDVYMSCILGGLMWPVGIPVTFIMTYNL